MSASWTIAYRKPHANRFRRVADWSGTQRQATEMAARFASAHPELQVHTAPCDVRRLLVGRGRYVRVVDTGTISDLVPDAQRGVRYIPKAYLGDGTEWEWGVYDIATKEFILGGCERDEAVELARRAGELQQSALVDDGSGIR